MSTDCWGINGLTDSPEDEARDRAHEVADMPTRACVTLHDRVAELTGQWRATHRSIG